MIYIKTGALRTGFLHFYIGKHLAVSHADFAERNGGLSAWQTLSGKGLALGTAAAVQERAFFSDI